MFPERALEELLGLVRSLTAKIEVINQTGFLDASVLGEAVTPRDFNTLKRIADEDESVIEEQESVVFQKWIWQLLMPLIHHMLFPSISTFETLPKNPSSNLRVARRYSQNYKKS